MLLSVAERANAKDLTQAQMQELVAQDEQLQNQRSRFGVTIATYLRAMNAQGATTTSKTEDVEMVAKCRDVCNRQPPRRLSLVQPSNLQFDFGSPR